MSKINLLSSKIYNRIAAGEVIERPASVVKELVENSIDAKSTVIEVEILNGGLSCIIVTDNGLGIEKDQLKKALLPHATSKISALNDLDAITTLGFRGEALPSIASVSKMTIRSKTEGQEFGAEIFAKGDEIFPPEDCALPEGTQIVVENLFFNAPVRAKFLKSEKGEEGEITSLMAKFILGNPKISFKYIADGKVLLQSFGDDIESSFLSVYGLQALNECFYLDVEKNGIRVNGYLGKPSFYKANRTYQTVFINGRSVSNNTISSAISNAFTPYLMKRQYPFYVLNITMPVDAVDVNVHPNKTDVRFINNQIIYGTLYSICSKVLSENRSVVSLESLDAPKVEQTVNEKKKPKAKKNTYNLHDDFSFFETLYFESPTPQENSKEDNVNDVYAENKKYLEELERKNSQEKPEPIKEEVVKNNPQNVSEIKIEQQLIYVGQALNTYLIYQSEEDLYFADQHALHERILFDKIIESFDKKDLVTQPFLTPYVLTVNNLEFNFLQENIEILKNMGIDICAFGDNSFKISALPIYFADFNVKKFFDDILADMGTLKNLSAKDLLKDKFAQKACKSAIKSGDKLSKEEIEELTKVLKNNMAIKCPHGRPVVIKITRTDIDKWFKRIV